MATLEAMAKKKTHSDEPPPPINVRFPKPLRKQLDKLCDRHASQIGEEVRIAVRERLERHGLWPPPPDTK